MRPVRDLVPDGKIMVDAQAKIGQQHDGNDLNGLIISFTPDEQFLKPVDIDHDKDQQQASGDDEVFGDQRVGRSWVL